MARFRGSVRKMARNLGNTQDGFTLDGYPKTDNIKRAYPSGQHGQMRRKMSEFAIQLTEKQRLRKTYGILEKQFRRYYDMAIRKKGVTGTILMQILESRLDNLVYRAGFAHSRPQARQLVTHGHILVDGKKVDIPSYLVKPGQKLSVREKSQSFVKVLLDAENRPIPHWLDSNLTQFEATLKLLPERVDMDQKVKENLIIEFYSR